MQLEAKDRLKSKRILVQLVEQSLLEYERNAADLDEEDSSMDSNIDNLFLQLNTLLGEVFVEALNILDEQSILLYTFESSEIAEIQIKRHQSKRSFWLFARVNYCTCKQFKVGVLGIADEQLTVSSTPQCENSENKFTCAHVLALRLAQVLHPTPSTFKIEAVTEQQFKNLQDRMYYSFLEVFKENLD